MIPIMIIALLLGQRTAHINHDNLCYYKCNLIYLGPFSEIIVHTISDFCRISSLVPMGNVLLYEFLQMLQPWDVVHHHFAHKVDHPALNTFGEIILRQDFHGIKVHCGNDVIDPQVRERPTAADHERHCHKQETVSMLSWTMLRFQQQLDVVPAKFIINMRLTFLQLEKIIYGYG